MTMEHVQNVFASLVRENQSTITLSRCVSPAARNRFWAIFVKYVHTNLTLWCRHTHLWIFVMFLLMSLSSYIVEMQFKHFRDGRISFFVSILSCHPIWFTARVTGPIREQRAHVFTSHCHHWTNPSTCTYMIGWILCPSAISQPPHTEIFKASLSQCLQER